MPWPPNVLRQFEIPPDAAPSETDFHGAYNKLLNTLFPPNTEFTVVPHYLPYSHELALFFFYEVLFKDKPVFILELKLADDDVQCPIARENADQQVRSRIRDFHADCPLPVFHVVSAMGTQLCFYRKPRNEPVVPPFIPADRVLMTDTVPRACWNCDILEEEGEQRFRAVVGEIKQACAAL
ncbi:hypothetical protein BU17DRAFT_71342 [Hysterangium stoloniferum]|nr:hypothetical protein BU17DRAFT_71342 [Hysterangium stoloniferum]